MNKKVIFLTLLAILIACTSADPLHKSYDRCAPQHFFTDQTNYNVTPTEFTPKNIAVDPSGLNINLSMIDRLTDEVETCLTNTFGKDGILPPDVVKDGQCIRNNTFQLPIHRECLTVKVANDWFLSKYEYGGTLHQLLPYTNGGQCTDKGLPAGVCYYRVGIQDNLTIVVPPSFLLYKDGLVRIVTGCYNPWYAPSLAACMNPTTGALDDGSQP